MADINLQINESTPVNITVEPETQPIGIQIVEAPSVEVSMVATGAKGATGQNATIEVGSTQTIDPNQPAVVTNSGTSSAAIFNFQIPKGNTGETGTPGSEVELQVTETHIQWRYTDGEWANLIAISELVGAQGAAGADGEEVSLQKSATHIQWKYTSDESWTDLVALTELVGATGATGAAGADGEEVQLRVDSGYIEWKLEGSESWTQLIALTELKGEQGDPGTNGTNGVDGVGVPEGGTTGQVLKKKSNDNYDTEFGDLVAVSVTTKGDIQTHNGTDPARLPVGTNGQVLSADSGEATGAKWIDPIGTNSTYSEVPTGDIDGSNADFVLAHTPSSILGVFHNRTFLKETEDYTLSGSTITLVDIPQTGDDLVVVYFANGSASGNADTLDGFHANSTPTANNIPVLDGSALLPATTIPKASGADVTTGTEDAEFVTPKSLADAGVNTRLASKVITATRDLSASDGNVAYTGVGFKPTSIIVLASVNYTNRFAIGMADSSKTNAALTQYEDSANLIKAVLLAIAPSSIDYVDVAVVSYDNDGLTLSFTKTGSPTGTGTFYILCLR